MDFKLTKKAHDCRQCILQNKCSDYNENDPIVQCKAFKALSKHPHIKLAPGDTVWLTQHPSIAHGEIVEKSIVCVSIYADKTIYHCDDYSFDNNAFGVSAFMSLDAAKIISRMRGGIING